MASTIVYPSGMRTVQQWIGAFIISLYPKRWASGVRVTFSDLSVDRTECTSRLSRAFALMRATGPRYASLASRIRHIVVWPGNHTFADNTAAVHIASMDLLGIGDLALASVLVHESVHLRISALGVKYEPKKRERIERRCVREQARFLRATPGDGAAMANEAEAALGLKWWSPEQRQADLQELLDEHRLPRWLSTIVRRA